MICPKCAAKTYVVSTETNIIVERYRKCCKCSYSFLTVEMVKTDILLMEHKEAQLSTLKKKSY